MAAASPRPSATERSSRPRGQWLTISIILLAVAGIVVSVELTHVHYKVNTDPDFVSFCNIGEAVNCETVAASSYSELLGVPVAVWAIFAYVVLLGLGLAGTRRTEVAPSGFPGLVLLWASAAAAWTIAMAIISAVIIASFCILCGALYVVNAALFVLAVCLARRVVGGVGRAVAGDFRRLARAPAATGGVAALLLAATVAVVLWYPDVHASVADLPETPPKPGPEACGPGHTAEGFPLFGAAEGIVTIEEYSDYECGHCKKAHALVRKLVHDYHDRVRLVHRHFPLDNACNPSIPRPFHANACLASKAAICADRQGKFWEFNDLLFERQREIAPENIVPWAGELGLDVPQFQQCLDASATESELQRDIRDGVGWGVRGTPSFVINGEFVKGARNEAGFRQLIDDALARCK